MNKSWEENLREIEPYVPGEQPKKKDFIKLNANENPYPPSPKAVEAINNYDCNKLRLYPDMNATLLKSVIADYHNVGIENVFLGNGSDDLLAIAFMSFFNSGKPILFPDITYTFYKIWCDLFKVPYETVKLNDDFLINPKDYNVKKGGVIFPNPNAPTGMGQGLKFIEEILSYSKDCIVVSDEAYVDFGGETALPLIKAYENLFIARTFSKSRSLAGLRIAYGIGSKRLIDTMESVKNSFNSYTIDSITMEAASASIRDEVYFNETIKKVIETREYTSKSLKELGFRVYPSKSNFLFVTHTSLKAKYIFEALKERDIYIRYFNLPRIDNHLRITIGTKEDMDSLIRELKSIII